MVAEGISQKSGGGRRIARKGMVDCGTAKSEHPGSDGLLGLEQVVGRSHYGDSMMEMERDDFANKIFRAGIL